MPPHPELRAWSNMIALAPPSVRVDPELHRAWVLRRGREIAGLPVRVTPRAAAPSWSAGEVAAVVTIGGLAIAGGFFLGRWLKTKWEERKTNYLLGVDALATPYEALAKMNG